MLFRSNKWAQGSNLFNRMVISERRDSMDYLQKLENGKYAEKATLKAITTILPNNFEFQTVLVASDWRRFDRRSFDERLFR